MKTFFAILFCSFFLSPAKGNKSTIVFLIAEREYQTDETLPVFAEEKLGSKYIIKYCTAQKEGSDRHVLRNAGAIESAHLLFVSVRRRAFSDKTMNMLRNHVEQGKPVIGIRTASHAFALRKETPPDGHTTWDEWDKKIMGGNYDGHYGKDKACRVDRFPTGRDHPILKNLKLPFDTPASLYRNSPLPSESVPLLRGTIEGLLPNRSPGRTDRLTAAKRSTPHSVTWRTSRNLPSTSFFSTPCNGALKKNSLLGQFEGGRSCLRHPRNSPF